MFLLNSTHAPPPSPALPAPKFPSPEFPFDLHLEGNSSAQGWAPREHCHTNTQPFLLERCNSLENPYLAYRLAPYSGALPSEKQQAHITPLPLAGPAQMGSGTGQCHRKPEPRRGQGAECNLYPRAVLGSSELHVIWGGGAPVEEMIQKDSGMR